MYSMIFFNIVSVDFFFKLIFVFGEVKIGIIILHVLATYLLNFGTSKADE